MSHDTGWRSIVKDEPHVHLPSNICTLVEFEDPENVGIRCGACGWLFDMTPREWQEFCRWWIFGRGELT